MIKLREIWSEIVLITPTVYESKVGIAALNNNLFTFCSDRLEV